MRPQHWDVVVGALVGKDLRPYHVIVSAEFDELVAETVNTVRSKMRPKLKSRTELLPADVEDTTNSATEKPMLQDESCALDLFPV